MKPDYQVRLLHPKRIQDSDRGKLRETATLDGIIRVGLYGRLAEQFTAAMTEDKPAAVSGMRLYLDGVAMEGLQPAIFQPEAANDVLPKPAWVLEFQLTRTAQDEANRKAWDALLPRLSFGGNAVQIGVGFNGQPAHPGDGRELSFQAVSKGKAWAVILCGLSLLVFVLVWAVRSGMLREAGPGTAYSLGKTQMAFWGLLVVLSFFGVWIVSGKMERIPDQVLVLVGISGTTGLAAMLIGDGKKTAAAQKAEELRGKIAEDAAKLAEIEARKTAMENERKAARETWPVEKEAILASLSMEAGSQAQALKKSREELAAREKESRAAPADKQWSAWFTDIISDASGPSFPRVQMMLWTLVLGAVFVKSVGTAFTMPEFDNTLLLLMGISNGTYLGFKMPEKNG
ncbi:MAG TPA: hypothetical protein DIT13_12345 [Verrucomicrobiales bacterium]|nr:hypothetical protein [Verrucomicrobiales bacterium]HRJ10406.1 cell envelope integrity protein TolA [Prosthecobacter sp.]HRK15456.1 cell envelope integrity protein TolA [Prosthecobacter sp.]